MSDPPRLKLLVIAMMYEPDCVGIAAIASDMCAALAERGHEVTVYTTYPYYPEWKLKTDASWRIQEEWIHNVRVRRHRIFVPSKPSRLIPRLIHELSFPISLLRSLFHGERQDVVMVYCPLMGGVAFTTLRKLWFRDPLWINIQDIPVEAAAASGIIRSSLLAQLASMVQAFFLNRADSWSSISLEMVEQLETIKSDKIPIHLCPNWLTGSLHEQIQKVSCKVGRTPQSTTKLLYCGTVGKKQGLLEFCQLLSQSDGAFDFEIRGEGGEADAVRQWVESSGDRRFRFDTLLSQSEFVSAIHAADWFVVPQKSSVGSSFFPSKLIPSISVGTPILAISETTGPLGHEVLSHGLGLVVPWSGVERVTSELEAFRQASERFETLQRNCVQRATCYQREFAIDKLESLLWEQCARSNGLVPTVCD